MGAIQLFAACQKAPSVRRVILKSTSEVYGSSARDPVLFTESSSRRRPPGEGFARDSIDIEGYARGLGRRRPDIAVTILRLANMIGPAMDTALSRYLAGPVVPTVIGHDSRLQLLHEQDALGALERATMAGKAGTFNVGASGIIMMSQAIRRSGRLALPVPRSALVAVDSLWRATRNTELDREQLDYLSYGRVMDTTRMRSDLGYSPEVDNRRGLRRLRARSWLDTDHRPAMGTLSGESRGGGGAALGTLDFTTENGVGREDLTWRASPKRKSFRCIRIRDAARLRGARLRSAPMVRADIRPCSPTRTTAHRPSRSPLSCARSISTAAPRRGCPPRTRRRPNSPSASPRSPTSSASG